MDELHRSLRRQLRKCGIDPDAGPESADDWKRFLNRVNVTYKSADQERYTAQRALDISSREMGELSHQIAADRERLVRMLESLPQAVVYTDADLVVQFSNAQAEELLFEVSAGAALEDHVELFDSAGVAIPLDRLTVGRRETSGYVQGRGQERIDASWDVVPIVVDEERTGILLVVTDLREVLEAEAELNQALLEAEVSRETEAARGRFLANISHELRTPLNAILGYSEMLHEDADGQDAQDLGRILHAGRHLLSLINDLLDLSKIDAGKMELAVSDFDLADLLEEVSATAEPLAQKRSNRLVVVNNVTHPVSTDVTRLRQCLLNLVGNAAKFTEEGEIRIEAHENGADTIKIAVVDTGAGIPRDRLRSIFDAFEQVQPGEQQGTGLGLALTKAFVQLMGGDIGAQSQVGKGSTFTIEIPRAIAS